MIGSREVEKNKMKFRKFFVAKSSLSVKKSRFPYNGLADIQSLNEDVVSSSGHLLAWYEKQPTVVSAGSRSRKPDLMHRLRDFDSLLKFAEYCRS